MHLLAAAGRRSATCRSRNSAVRGTPSALADEQRTKQVLLNLLSNAIKYNRERRRCRRQRRRARHAGSVAVRITDTGHGIAAEDLDRLFSPFDRLGAEQSAIEGTGLGLALSKLMVEAMDGSPRGRAACVAWAAPSSLELPARAARRA